jgi:hypothetical protein
LRLILDTGSSDLWCNAANSTLCSSSRDPCRVSGSYDPDSSSSYTYVSSDFNISYADGSGAAGDYVNDTLGIGGATIRDFQFGIGYSSSSAGMSGQARVPSKQYLQILILSGQRGSWGSATPRMKFRLLDSEMKLTLIFLSLWSRMV